MENTKERIEKNEIEQIDTLTKKLEQLLELQEKSIATVDRIINLLEN